MASSTKQNPREKKQKGYLGWLKFLFLCFIAVACVFFYVIFTLPDVRQLKDSSMQTPFRIFSADNQLIGEFGDKRRNPVTLKQVPRQLINAILDTEDRRFYEHPGVDFVGLVRATKELFLTGRKSQGASTITMQVARNFFLSPEKTYTRKIKEIMLAIKIDHEFTKDEILELYLNKVYFGQRAYGVSAAAQVYFGKTLNQLTLPEMALLAGLPQAPSADNPITNPKKALERRNHVLERMLANNDIDRSTYLHAIKAPIDAKYHGLQVSLNAPHLAEMVRQEFIAMYGEKAYNKGYTIYTTIDSQAQQNANLAVRNGLIAYTKRHGYFGPEANLGDEPDQKEWQTKLLQFQLVNGLFPAAVESFDGKSFKALMANGQTVKINWNGMSWARKRINENYLGPLPKQPSDIVKVGDVVRVEYVNNQWVMSEVPKVSAAFVAMDPKNGAILALVSGFSYGLNNFNCATQALRQAGSSFKPFIYSAALAKGYTLASIFNDAPIVISDSSVEGGFWRPENDTKKFYGPTRLRVALSESRNLVSIRVLQAIGIHYTINYLKLFGFDSEKLTPTLSLALGAAEITPLELNTGYAVFANGGYYVRPYFINKITDHRGKIVYQYQPKIAAENENADDADQSDLYAPRVITAQNAYLMTDALKDVIHEGTAQSANVLNRSDLAGKTGTTNNLNDGWFAGFNSDVVATVWVGFDKPTSLNEHGARDALPIWIEFMARYLQGKPLSTMEMPPGIVTHKIDPETGEPAEPDQEDALLELFIENSKSPAPESNSNEEPDDKNTSNSKSNSSDELF